MDSHLASTRAARIAVADKLVHHYRSGALLFPIDKLVALEKELSKDTAEVLIYDFYGNEWKFGKENYGFWWVFLYPLQHELDRIRRTTDLEWISTFTPFFYSISDSMANPLNAGTNSILDRHRLEMEAKTGPDTFANGTKVEIVTTRYEEVGSYWLRSNNFSDNILEFKDVISKQDINKIVCIDFLTFEDDMCKTARQMIYHQFALNIKRRCLSTNEKAPELQFYHVGYTQTTIDFIRGRGAKVFTDTISAFQEITDSTLVIWMGTDGNIPVKQIIADFSLQNLPLPRAMIWPEEGDKPTTYEELRERVHAERGPTEEGQVLVCRITDDTPRTNKLHEGYDKHELPAPPEGDPFHFTPKLAIYTRK